MRLLVLRSRVVGDAERRHDQRADERSDGDSAEAGGPAGEQQDEDGVRGHQREHPADIAPPLRGAVDDHHQRRERRDRRAPGARGRQQDRGREHAERDVADPGEPAGNERAVAGDAGHLQVRPGQQVADEDERHEAGRQTRASEQALAQQADQRHPGRRDRSRAEQRRRAAPPPRDDVGEVRRPDRARARECDDLGRPLPAAPQGEPEQQHLQADQQHEERNRRRPLRVGLHRLVPQLGRRRHLPDGPHRLADHRVGGGDAEAGQHRGRHVDQLDVRLPAGAGGGQRAGPEAGAVREDDVQVRAAAGRQAHHEDGRTGGDGVRDSAVGGRQGARDDPNRAAAAADAAGRIGGSQLAACTGAVDAPAGGAYEPAEQARLRALAAVLVQRALSGQRGRQGQVARTARRRRDDPVARPERQPGVDRTVLPRRRLDAEHAGGALALQPRQRRRPGRVDVGPAQPRHPDDNDPRRGLRVRRRRQRDQEQDEEQQASHPSSSRYTAATWSALPCSSGHVAATARPRSATAAA
ncbi:MAG: hypothetical protein LC789_02005 [Actinobacteria bacterium]|nr:hypothetical protein [Actinomycetota bacterium]